MDVPTVSESAPAAGARFTLDATVRNQGNGPSAFTTLRYYQSSDSTITTGDTGVGTDSVFSLDASESGDESISLTAPSTPGTYHYGACVDSVSGESNTTNNCSAAVTVTVGAVTSVPGAPAGLTATANGQTQIDLSWTAPSNDGGAAISGYLIEVSMDSSTWSDLESDTQSTTTTYSHSGLTSGSTRHYRVSAINSAGTGRASMVANATTDPSTAQQVGTGACSTDGAVPDAANNPGLVADCEILLAARDTLRGTATLNWSADTPIASWDAVTVSGRPRRVTKIDTSGEDLNLSGTIPPGLGSLTNLRILRLSSNELTGSIPSELGNLSNLEWLSLWNNELTGAIPQELGNLSALTLLRLEWNELTGTIPAQLGNLTNLDSMSLGGNRLTGPIPSEFGNLTNLRGLSLGGSNSGENQLTGPIPAELKNLNKLQSLNLWKNRISGPIPAWLGSLTDLGTLILSGNQLTGTIPVELGNLTKVRQFWLAHNQLTGTIPRELGNLTSVTELHLDDNRLTGDIPAELADLSGLRQLFLANNQLTGCIPQGLRDVAAQHDIARLDLPDCDTGSSTAVAPGVPTGLTATADGQTEIDLSWTAPSDDGGEAITGYKIEVSMDGSSWSDLVSNTRSTTTSYSHTGLTAGATRHYRVSAINSAGTGPASSSYSATTEAAPATTPGAPTGLTATANGQTQIDLSWTAPSDNGGEDITGYKIEVSTNGSSWSDLVANTGSGSTTYSHTGLKAGNTRHYRVSAINSAGTSPASNTDSATTAAAPATRPGAPTGLTATADGQTQIDLSWTAPSDDGGASITGYRIEVSTDGSSWSDLVADTGSTTTSYSHTGLTAGTTRHYRVSAINSAGTSPASNTDSATTAAAPATRPGAPTGLTATADGQTEIDLSWTAPSYDGGASITGYRIEVSTDGSSWSDLVADTGSTTTSYSHTGLTAGATRHYRVSAINSAGTGPASNSDSATTDSASQAVPPNSPANARYSRDGSTIVVSWDAVSEATHYKVYYSDFFDSDCVLISDRPTFCEELAANVAGTTYTHTDPDDDSNYYWITACNSAGCSDIDKLNPAQFIDNRPSAPANVRVSREGSSLVVSWDAVPSATYYKVYYSDFFDSNCQLISGRPTYCEELAANVAGTTYTHTGQSILKPKSPSIKVIDRSSNSLTVRWSDWADTNYYWITACNSAGCSEIANSSSSSYPLGAQYYQLSRSLSRESGFTLLQSRSTDSRLVDQELEPSTIYYYRILGCNDYGCSDPSQTGGLTESDGTVDIPSTPTGVQGDKVRRLFWPDDARVSWNMVEGATYYKVYQGSKLEVEVSAPQVRYYDGSPNRIFGALASTSYKVQACNKAGCSPFSESVTVSALGEKGERLRHEQ